MKPKYQIIYNKRIKKQKILNNYINVNFNNIDMSNNEILPSVIKFDICFRLKRGKLKILFISFYNDIPKYMKSDIRQAILLDIKKFKNAIIGYKKSKRNIVHAYTTLIDLMFKQITIFNNMNMRFYSIKTFNKVISNQSSMINTVNFIGECCHPNSL